MLWIGQYLGFSKDYNPLSLADIYRTLPGVLYAEQNALTFLMGTFPMFPGFLIRRNDLRLCPKLQQHKPHIFIFSIYKWQANLHRAMDVLFCLSPTLGGRSTNEHRQLRCMAWKWWVFAQPY